MQTAIRFIGILNAALWFGSVVFFTVVGGPAFFSPEMESILPRPYAARAVEVVLARFYSLQMLCAFVALMHLAVEYFHCGRAPSRWSVGLLTALLAFNLISGFGLQPKMHRLQAVRYLPSSTEVQRAEAIRSFAVWHGVAQTLNLLVLVGLGIHLWTVTRPITTPRFSTWDKFRG